MFHLLLSQIPGLTGKYQVRFLQGSWQHEETPVLHITEIRRIAQEMGWEIIFKK